MSRGRFQWDDNGDHLDEIVLDNVTFHIERMSHHGWWIGVTDPKTGEHLSLNFYASSEPVVEDDYRDVDREICGPLLYHAPPWTDDLDIEHRCEVDNRPTHRKCRCECGATTRNTH